MRAEGRGRALGLLLGLALSAALAACAAAPRAPGGPQRIGAAAPAATAPAGTPQGTTRPVAPTAFASGLGGAAQTLTLAVGETAALGEGGASLSLDRVVEDSRCPANARCVWQGRVVVEGRLTAGGQSIPFTLGTLDGFEDAPASFAAGPYTLSIATVEPHPDTPEGVPQDAYALTFEIGHTP